MIRVLIALVSLASSFSAARAESVQEAAVSLFKEVCLDAKTYQFQLDRAKVFASARGWMEAVPKKPAAEPPILEGPGVSLAKAWELGLVGTVRAQLVIGVFGSTGPDSRYHVCMLNVSVAPFYQELSTELERQLGSRKKEFSGSTLWVFSGRLGQEADCRETIALLPVSPQGTKPTSLMFTDLSYFKNDKWQAAMPQAWCQS